MPTCAQECFGGSEVLDENWKIKMSYNIHSVPSSVICKDEIDVL